MIKISHRGNLYGPNLNDENKVEYILNAINAGFDVEVDTWLIDNNLYFGHDKPAYKIDLEMFDNIKTSCWFHCKNLQSLEYFIKNYPHLKFFWHQQDDFTITSNNYIWTYPGQKVGEFSIIVDLDLKDPSMYNGIYGICSDYIATLNEGL